MRRSQKDGITWARMTQLVDDWLPKPIILHPWPSDRFAVTHQRWEPYAGKPHVRFCAGGSVMGVPTASVRSCFASQRTANTASIVDSRLPSIWRMIVSVVEPVRQRTNPNSSPVTKRAANSYQTGGKCINDQTNDIDTMLGTASRGLRTKPRNTNPRNKSSSWIDPAMIIPTHIQTNEPSVIAERTNSTCLGSTTSRPSTKARASVSPIRRARATTASPTCRQRGISSPRYGSTLRLDHLMATARVRTTVGAKTSVSVPAIHP
jgi:hypothetical protein